MWGLAAEQGPQEEVQMFLTLDPGGPAREAAQGPQAGSHRASAGPHVRY